MGLPVKYYFIEIWETIKSLFRKKKGEIRLMELRRIDGPGLAQFVEKHNGDLKKAWQAIRLYHINIKILWMTI
jgi:hypothetical protein